MVRTFLVAACFGLVAAVQQTRDLPSDIPATNTFYQKGHNATHFEGQQVLAVGGTSGIGFATAARFAQECADVMLVSRNPDKTELSKQILESISTHCDKSQKIETMNANIMLPKSINKIFKFFRDHNRKIDIIFHSAGIGGYIGDLTTMPHQEQESLLGSFDDPILINLYGTIRLNIAAADFWKDNTTVKGDRFPLLFNVASEQAFTTCPTCALYAGAKHGIEGFSRSFANTQQHILRLQVIAPGLVDTPLTWNQLRLFDGHQPNECEYKGKFQMFDYTGYKTRCPDIVPDKAKLVKAFGEIYNLVIDPTDIAKKILSEARSKETGLQDTIIFKNVDTNAPVNEQFKYMMCPSNLTTACKNTN
mmetsp:Transcript_15681/g.27344  ORF Transcript_15681/g.27344 Transcript_15681/m.27344 type:complete len:363 (-) Transcript_15681:28-1116(-)